VVVACRFILDVVAGSTPERKRQVGCPETECSDEFCWLVWAVPINLADNTLMFAGAIRSEPQDMQGGYYYDQQNTHELVDMTVNRAGRVFVMERRVVPASIDEGRDEELQTRIWGIQHYRKFGIGPLCVRSCRTKSSLCLTCFVGCCV
jgi:hypothetical protein